MRSSAFPHKTFLFPQETLCSFASLVLPRNFSAIPLQLFCIPLRIFAFSRKFFGSHEKLFTCKKFGFPKKLCMYLQNFCFFPKKLCVHLYKTFTPSQEALHLLTKVLTQKQRTQIYFSSHIFTSPCALRGSSTNQIFLYICSARKRHASYMMGADGS